MPEQPRMIVVAGPPGSGKSTAFPVSAQGVDFFNADDRAAQLSGSYTNISPYIRTQVNAELQQFIEDHIERLESFAFETTLRTLITRDQARLARKRGFLTFMIYVSAGTADQCIERVMIRADAGGHSAPVALLREIYDASLWNLGLMFDEFDRVEAFDNSRVNEQPQRVLISTKGNLEFVPNLPQQILLNWQIPLISRVFEKHEP